MSDSNKLVDIVQELDFIPSRDQRQLKAAFWASQAENPLVDPDAPLSLEAVRMAVKDRRLATWWKDKGFRDWFQNREEYRQRIEYVAHLAIDAIEEILVDKDATPGARVNAAKLAIEAANKMPARRIEKGAPEDPINNMDEAQLIEYVKRRVPKLLK